MSRILVRERKTEKELQFQSLIEDEYEWCIEEIINSINKGLDKTIYTITINKIQSFWDPLTATYTILEKLRADDFIVYYRKPTSLFIVHPNEQPRYHKLSKGEIIYKLEQENKKTKDAIKSNK